MSIDLHGDIDRSVAAKFEFMAYSKLAAGKILNICIFEFTCIFEYTWSFCGLISNTGPQNDGPVTSNLRLQLRRGGRGLVTRNVGHRQR